jgi:hypothetical protein
MQPLIVLVALWVALFGLCSAENPPVLWTVRSWLLSAANSCSFSRCCPMCSGLAAAGRTLPDRKSMALWASRAHPCFPAMFLVTRQTMACRGSRTLEMIWCSGLPEEAWARLACFATILRRPGGDTWAAADTVNPCPFMVMIVWSRCRLEFATGTTGVADSTCRPGNRGLFLFSAFDVPNRYRPSAGFSI